MESCFIYNPGPISVTDCNLGLHRIEVDAQQNLFNWTYNISDPSRIRARAFKKLVTSDATDAILTRSGTAREA